MDQANVGAFFVTSISHKRFGSDEMITLSPDTHGSEYCKQAAIHCSIGWQIFRAF